MVNKKKVKIIDGKTNKTICEYTIDDQIVIQCYSPDWWHNPQALVMNQKGKEALLKALQENKELSVIDAMTTDGEGFTLSVVIKSADDIDKEFILPYTDDPAKQLEVGKKTPVYEGYALKDSNQKNKPFTKEQVESYHKNKE